MLRCRLAALSVVTSVIALIAAPAFAQASDPLVPQPDPPGTWRKLTLDDATTTSRCIGNPVTPLCAVETYWACFLRRQPELCDMVQAGVRPVSREPRVRPDIREDYRIAYARRPSPLDPVDPATEGNMKPQAGDVVIGMIRRLCFGPLDDDSDCSLGVENDPPYVHMLRRQGDIWVYAYRFRARF